MKKYVKPLKNSVKRVILTGSRQVVESAIDATKSSRDRSWEASANAASKKGHRSVRIPTCYDD